MSLSESDRTGIIAKYQKHYADFGYSPKALGWDKGRQDIRFEVLLSFFNCRGKSILDLGCGFGDLNRVLSKQYGSDYHYLGVDLVEELLQEGRQRYAGDHIRFLSGDFLKMDFGENYDIVLASGIFNHKFSSLQNSAFITESLAKAFSLAREGLAFDFLSDKVEFRHEHTFHSSPEEILSMAYRHSRNVVLRNDYMPFEFTLYVAKDDSFDRADAVFHTHKMKMGRRSGPIPVNL